MELVFKKPPSPSMPDFEGFLGWKLLFLLNEKPSDLPLLRASKRALVSWASFLKKEKKNKKLYLSLSSFSIQGVPLGIFAKR